MLFLSLSLCVLVCRGVGSVSLTRCNGRGDEKKRKKCGERKQKEHNHPLAPPGKVHCLRSHRGDKDKTIRELTHELERVNQKCAAYRSRLLMVLKDVEEHLTKKVEDVRQSIRDIESEEQDH
ncbi:hypothetical protein AAC387_Pa01g0920 [Persea americana]